MAAIEEALAERNAGVCVRLVQHVSTALLTGSYRHERGGVGSAAERGAAVRPTLLPPDLQAGNGHKPYFEALVVTPTDPVAVGARARTS